MGPQSSQPKSQNAAPSQHTQNLAQPAGKSSHLSSSPDSCHVSDPSSNLDSTTASYATAPPSQAQKRTAWSILSQALRSLAGFPQPDSRIELDKSAPKPPEQSINSTTATSPDSPKAFNNEGKLQAPKQSERKARPDMQRHDHNITNKSITSSNVVKQSVSGPYPSAHKVAGPVSQLASTASARSPAPSADTLATTSLPTVRRAQRPIGEQINANQSDPERRLHGSHSDAFTSAPGRLHELALAFKQTPLPAIPAARKSQRKVAKVVQPRESDLSTIKQASADASSRFEVLSWDMLMPHEVATLEASKAKMNHHPVNEPESLSSDLEAEALVTKPAARTIGHMMTGKDSLEDAMLSRGLQSSSKMKVNQKDSLVAKSPSSQTSKSNTVPDNGMNGRKAVERRRNQNMNASVADNDRPDLRSSMPHSNTPPTSDIFFHEVVARSGLAPLESPIPATPPSATPSDSKRGRGPFRDSQRRVTHDHDRKHADTASSRNRRLQPPLDVPVQKTPTLERPNSVRKIARVDAKSSQQSQKPQASHFNPAPLGDSDWDLFSAPLLPTVPADNTAESTIRSVDTRSNFSHEKDRTIPRKRSPFAASVERAQTSSEFRRSKRTSDNEFSWDAWAEDINVFRSPDASTQQSSTPAGATGGHGSHSEWHDVDQQIQYPRAAKQTKRTQSEGGSSDRTSTVPDSFDLAFSSLLASNEGTARKNPVSNPVLPDVAPVTVVEDSDGGWDDSRRARGRGRRDGRESRYEVSQAEELETSDSNTRIGRQRDRDRIRDRDQGDWSKSKGSRRGASYAQTSDWEDEYEDRQRRNREKRLQKEQETQMEPAQPDVPQISIPEFIAVEDLAKAMGLPAVDLARALVEFGFDSLTTKSVLTGETAGLIAQEYGYEAKIDEGAARDLRPRPPPVDPSSLPGRPPVVTIMGHVDHGKTTMLDYLRKSSVAAQESGGITQHIGAFVVPLSSGKKITFLDTPGHAAFLAMRQRGANATDIVILVVAADDSVMPQTIEALNHAKNAKVPVIVAINKVDKPGARLEEVKNDLARNGVDIEDFGGDVQVVCTSGKTGVGMADLEETILTLSEVLDIRAEPDGMAEGYIIESSIKQVGKSAVVLVKRGTLRTGDIIVAGTSWTRIRLLRNEAGQEIDEAPPGTPAEVIGWGDSLPDAGDELIEAPDEGRARAAIMYRLEMREREQNIDEAARQEKRRVEEEAARRAASEAALSDEDSESALTSTAAATTAATAAALLSQVQTVNYVIKADVAGSAEAVAGAIQQLGNHEVQPRVLRSGAGAITEWDIEHAAISGSTIISFNIATSPPIRNLAQKSGVTILEHSIIYRLSDEVKAILSTHLADKVTFRVTGEAELLQVFPINLRARVFHNVAGCRVRNGSISAGDKIRVSRRGVVVFEGTYFYKVTLLMQFHHRTVIATYRLLIHLGKIDELRKGKKTINMAPKGDECGISISKFEDWQVGDTIQTLEEVRESRTL